MRRSLKELADALGVEEAEFKVQPDPHQLAAKQRAIRRARNSKVRGVDFNAGTGRKD